MLLQFLLGATAVIIQVYSISDNRYYNRTEEHAYKHRYFILEENYEFVYEYLNAEAENEAEPLTTLDITIYLYTRASKYPDVIPINNMDTVVFTNFNITKKMVFTIHGWKNNYQSNFNVVAKHAILNAYDVNLFVVDWSNVAKMQYRKAKKTVQSIGEHLAKFMNFILKTYNLNPKDFILVGHSLGAHIAGCAGAHLKTLTNELINSIIALDPASPLFKFSNVENRVDPSDADFVQIIHTSGGTLGFSSSIGHADYYPNGGFTQPGCGLDFFGKCAHSRAYHYFAESLSQSEFLARRCNNHKSYVRGECDGKHQSYMGNLFVDKMAMGDYYLMTNRRPPYALNSSLYNKTNKCNDKCNF